MRVSPSQFILPPFPAGPHGSGSTGDTCAGRQIKNTQVHHTQFTNCVFVAVCWVWADSLCGVEFEPFFPIGYDAYLRQVTGGHLAEAQVIHRQGAQKGINSKGNIIDISYLK